MTPVQAIVAKELKVAFVSPIVYVLGAVFLLCFGALSYALVQVAGEMALGQTPGQGIPAQLNLNDLVFRPAFIWTGLLFFMILLPLLTMRLFAEERRHRTFELLATSPIGINEMVVGKFLGVFTILLGLLALTGVVPLILSLFSSFSWPPVFTGYLALILLGALFLSTGVLTSALTENQIVAALLSFGLIFLLWLLGYIGQTIGTHPLGAAISYLSFGEHFNRLIRGLVETRDLLYFLSGTILMLFLAHRVIETHRWT